ncbi:probable G-protein coupled receptor 82 [Denticeps clupeoides]|uniref:G-protein coupled receptors family 1 profile domain-containing protein n=1 Tax=Denticeps clupeoides TaxID=299321 RepID=A0AAY4DVG0_9TELE|nr:probable G-protein coupled receptor 82 [Denticeps clupeoides]
MENALTFNVSLDCGLNYNASSLCQTSITHLILPVLYSVMFLTSLSGNVLSLWVFVYKISEKSPTHIYIINLGLSNLLLCLVMPFLVAYYSRGHSWHTNHLICKVATNGLMPILHANICVGMSILTWLALSRLATLIKHSHSNRPSRCTRILPSVFLQQLRHKRFAWMACLATWLVVVAILIPTTIMYSANTTEEQESWLPCYNKAAEVGVNQSQMTAIVGIIAFFLCFLLVLSSYFAVMRHICRLRRCSAISNSHRVYARVYRNIVVIQVVLATCLLPHHVFKAIFVKMAFHHTSSEDTAEQCHSLSSYVEVKNLFLCLAVLRCSTDPIMYFLLDKTFRKQTLRLLLLVSTNGSGQSTGSMQECGRTSQGSKAMQ